MSNISRIDKMRESLRESLRETQEYIASFQFDDPEESDALCVHKNTAADQEEGTETINDCIMVTNTEMLVTNSTAEFPHKSVTSNSPPWGSSFRPFDSNHSPGDSSCFYQNHNFLLVGENEKLVQQSVAADEVGKLIKYEYAYNREANDWHIWFGYYWKLCNAYDVDAAITDLIRLGAGSKGFNIGYQRGVFGIIKKLKFIELPKRMPETIPFQNGLLVVPTKQLLPIAPDNAATWALPFEYTESARCHQFISWLRQAVDGDEETVQFLRAYINAVLVGRPELQIFLHIIGPGGTGKSTFGRMLFRLVGDENATTTTLKQLENNRFETANIYGKRLVAIEEAHKYGGSVSVLKSMIGQDPLRLERKNQQQTGSFIYEGQTIMMSNERFVTNDHTSGIERRRITVEFSHRISQEERASWDARGGEEAILYTEIPGIINWALGLTDQEVRAIFKNIPRGIRQANLDAARANNPVLDWMLENLIPEADASVQIGNKQQFQEEGETKFKDSETRLYPHYLTWCRRKGIQATPLQRFGTVILDLAATNGVTLNHSRKKDGTKITGIRFRRNWETSWLESIEAPSR